MGADYNDDIAQGMKYRRWLQIKIVKNLQKKHRNKERTGRLQPEIQIGLHTVMIYLQHPFYHKELRT